VKDVFDLFDFWDGRDGYVDGAKVGDMMRCIGLNPTVALIKKNGGEDKLGMCHVTDARDVDTATAERAPRGDGWRDERLAVI